MHISIMVKYIKHTFVSYKNKCDMEKVIFQKNVNKFLLLHKQKLSKWILILIVSCLFVA